MNVGIWKKYSQCIRFDDGEKCCEKEYRDIVRKKERIVELIRSAYGASVLPMLEEYTEIMYEEMELEAQHYFEQGYLQGERQNVH